MSTCHPMRTFRRFSSMDHSSTNLELSCFGVSHSKETIRSVSSRSEETQYSHRPYLIPILPQPLWVACPQNNGSTGFELQVHRLLVSLGGFDSLLTTRQGSVRSCKVEPPTSPSLESVNLLHHPRREVFLNTSHRYGSWVRMQNEDGDHFSV